MTFDEYYFKNEKYLLELLNSSQYVYTAKAIKRFYLKIKSISDVIQNLDTDSDKYTILLLMRSLIEHYITFLYILIKFVVEKNDSIAESYYTEYSLGEFVKRIQTNKRNEVAQDSKFAEIFIKAFLNSETTERASQPILQMMHSMRKKFDFYKTSKFVFENMHKITRFYRADNIKELIGAYNFYSTFVHGGHTADTLYFDIDKSIMISEATKTKEWSEKLLSILRIYKIYYLSFENENIKKEMVKILDM